MKLLLQRPHPDELLSSALVRTCLRFDLPIGHLMQSLHGHRSPPGFFHLTNMKVYGQALCLSEDHLLKTATVFPYLVAFQPWDRRVAFRMAAIQGKGTKDARLSALQRTSLYVPYRKLCPSCVRSDKARFGWSYWHVSHHLPGVTLCPIHSERLRETALETRSGTKHWTYALPHDVVQATGRQRIRSLSAFERELDSLTMQTQAEELAYALGPLPIGLYRRMLEKVGLLGPGKAMKSDAANAWIGRLLRNAPSCAHLLAEDPELTWVERLLRDRPASPSPAAKHLVLLAAVACTPKPDRPLLNHKPSGIRKRDVSQRDQDCAVELARQFKEARSAKTPLRLYEALGRMKVWSGFRHERSRFPELGKVVTNNRDHLEWSRIQLSRLAKQTRVLAVQVQKD